MNKHEEQFDDPALKSALGRVWDRESCPPGLRAQIQAAIATADEIDQPAPRRQSQGSNVWNRPLSPMSLAAAAMFVLLGAGVWIYYGVFAPDDVGRPGPVTLSSDLVTAMILVHDQSSVIPTTTAFLSTSDDFPSLRKILLSKLRRPVWVSDLTKAGWQFRGARIANVENNPAADLVFTKDDRTLSLLSLPGPPSCEGYAQDYELASNNHDVVGFGVGGSLFCLVESSRSTPLNLDELKKLRDTFRNDALTALNLEPSPPTTRPN
jgi:hypothetical protein